DGSADSDGNSDYVIEPLQGLETKRKSCNKKMGFETRMVSQDLQLWLSNVSFLYY
ncbi:hypothetical protein Tco_0592183, partial [Tanacetum coccineum]